jgi:predicted secreted protein
MDIAKYIGQFLLKNNYCYIHGLGNLELVKKPAVHDGKSLVAPSFTIILTSGGSIDDSFANFIATNEQISISKAANGLRDFSIKAREELAAGKEVIVDGTGKFVEEKGKISFITDANFIYTPSGMPSIKNSKQLEEQKIAPATKPTYPAPPAKSGSVNWTTIIIAAIFLLLLAGGGVAFYLYDQQQKSNSEELALVDSTSMTAPPLAIDSTPAVDTLALAPAQPAIDTNALMDYKVVIGIYASRRDAEKRFRQLKLGGHPIEVLTKDSINFTILMPIHCRMVDTSHQIDSLATWFGYNMAHIYRE